MLQAARRELPDPVGVRPKLVSKGRRRVCDDALHRASPFDQYWFSGHFTCVGVPLNEKLSDCGALAVATIGFFLLWGAVGTDVPPR